MEYFVTLSEYLDSHIIKGIKSLRLTFDLGLYDAKTIMDEVKTSGKSMHMSSDEAFRLEQEGFIVTPHGSLPKPTKREVRVYIPEEVLIGRKIEAIKRMRYETRLGLKEAKDIIDEMWSYNRPIILRNHVEVTDDVVYRLIEQGFTVTGYVHECFKENEDLFII